MYTLHTNIYGEQMTNMLRRILPHSVHPPGRGVSVTRDMPMSPRERMVLTAFDNGNTQRDWRFRHHHGVLVKAHDIQHSLEQRKVDDKTQI